MLAPVAVADASSLVILLDGNLEDHLPIAFRRVLLPRHVERELSRKGKRRRSQLRRLLADGAMERCTDYPEAVVGIWHAYLRPGGASSMQKQAKPHRDLGEAEALAQCASRDVRVIMTEDTKAIVLAQTAGFQVFRASDVARE